MPLEIEVYRQRRQAFQKKMEPGSRALFFSAALQVRSNDVHYPFRQNSDFFYLTGFCEEEAVLVLGVQEEQLFLRPRDPEKELWDGPLLGIERVPEVLGISRAKPFDSFYKHLEQLLKNCIQLYYRFGLDAQRDTHIFSCARKLLEGRRQGSHGPARITSPNAILHEMRMIKSEQELSLLRESARITHQGHLSLLKYTDADMCEYELEAILEYEFRRHNGVQAYPPIVASGPNACILHYTHNKRQMAAGDLVLVDAAAEKSCMATDVTRTFPVGKKFTPIQKEVYEIVLNAQKKAIECSLPDSSLNIIHDAATLSLIEGLIALKVLAGKAEDHFEAAKKIEKLNDPQRLKEIPYRHYFMHRCSHWLGMDVHDVGSYYENGRSRPLKEGMVFTVEPGLYFSAQDERLPEELRGLGVRIEDDIYVQTKKALVLTASIPKEVKEIEEIRSMSTKNTPNPRGIP